MEIGYKLKELRQKNKLTQAELAKKLHLTPQAISKWERNKSYPDLATLIKLSNLYQVSTDEILGLAKKSFLEQLFSKKNGGFNLLKELIKITNPDMYRFSLTDDFNLKNYPELQNLGVWRRIDAKTIDLIINQRSATNNLADITASFSIITNKTADDFFVERIYHVLH